MANHLDDLLTHRSGPIALIGIAGDIFHLTRVCTQVVQFVDIETVPNVFPISHHAPSRGQQAVPDLEHHDKSRQDWRFRR